MVWCLLADLLCISAILEQASVMVWRSGDGCCVMVIASVAHGSSGSRSPLMCLPRQVTVHLSVNYGLLLYRRLITCFPVYSLVNYGLLLSRWLMICFSVIAHVCGWFCRSS
ncbi:hypothetical protein BDV95DRAFT_280989 [Massariosphaeria phaeospora]|uniref:Secreted protein n=1 Tax=Massariosphaeria phaeospora TaxID=100035 RepID=A0A7C8IC04_9PLEO|nr:hypothetical protein BDV95DRAFT_280989 [Massariosphaeria phaeospora]